MPTEADWKLFRKLLPEWQERYMEKLCRDYIKVLSSNELASDRYWKIHKMVNRDAHKTGVQAEMSRSEMFFNILSLLKEKAITMKDLEVFSDELKDTVNMRVERV